VLKNRCGNAVPVIAAFFSEKNIPNGNAVPTPNEKTENSKTKVTDISVPLNY